MISKNVMGMLTTGPIPDPEPARNPALTPCLRLALSTPWPRFRPPRPCPGALITVGMAMAAALCCFSLRVLQRRSKGYNKAPLAGRSFDDPEDDDAGAPPPPPPSPPPWPSPWAPPWPQAWSSPWS